MNSIRELMLSYQPSFPFSRVLTLSTTFYPTPPHPYLSQVLPRPHGVPKHPLWFLLPDDAITISALGGGGATGGGGGSAVQAAKAAAAADAPPPSLGEGMWESGWGIIRCGPMCVASFNLKRQCVCVGFLLM